MAQHSGATGTTTKTMMFSGNGRFIFLCFNESHSASGLRFSKMLELIDRLPSKLLRHQVLSLAPATTNPPCGHSTVNRMGASCDYKFHDVWKLKYLFFFFFKKWMSTFFFCFVFDSLQFTAVIFATQGPDCTVSMWHCSALRYTFSTTWDPTTQIRYDVAESFGQRSCILIRRCRHCRNLDVFDAFWSWLFSNLEAVAGTLLGMPSVVANSGLAAVSVRPVLWQRWTECHECYSKPPNFKAGAVCNAGILALLSWHNALFWSSNLARLSVKAYPLLICSLETFENIRNEASDDKSVHLEVSMNYSLT